MQTNKRTHTRAQPKTHAHARATNSAYTRAIFYGACTLRACNQIRALSRTHGFSSFTHTRTRAQYFTALVSSSSVSTQYQMTRIFKQKDIRYINPILSFTPRRANGVGPPQSRESRLGSRLVSHVRPARRFLQWNTRPVTHFPGTRAVIYFCSPFSPV